MMLARTQSEMKQRAPWLLVGLLFLNIILMGVDANRKGGGLVVRVFIQAVVSPVQRVVSTITGTIGGVVYGIGNARSATSENEQLRQRVAQLETESNEMRLTKAENERLKALLDFKNSKQFETVPAQVISRDTTAWFNAVVINRGSSSGIKDGMPVVTPEGIVGRVIATSPWTSQIMLLTDEKSAAGGVIGQLGISESFGAIRGLGSDKGLIEMKYVSGLTTVNVGDVVTTTGQDRIYPPGLKIGEVIEVIQGSASMAHTIRIKPGAKINSLSEVAVLIYRAPEQPQMQQTLNEQEKEKR